MQVRLNAMFVASCTVAGAPDLRDDSTAVYLIRLCLKTEPVGGPARLSPRRRGKPRIVQLLNNRLEPVQARAVVPVYLILYFHVPVA